jgi:hypothetical protein
MSLCIYRMIAASLIFCLTADPCLASVTFKHPLPSSSSQNLFTSQALTSVSGSTARRIGIYVRAAVAFRQMITRERLGEWEMRARGVLDIGSAVGSVPPSGDAPSRPAYEAGRVEGPALERLIDISLAVAVLVGARLGFTLADTMQVVRNTEVGFYRWHQTSAAGEGRIYLFLTEDLTTPKRAFRLIHHMASEWAHRYRQVLFDYEKRKHISSAVEESFDWAAVLLVARDVGPEFFEQVSRVLGVEALSGGYLNRALKAVGISPDAFEGGASDQSRKALRWLFNDISGGARSGPLYEEAVHRLRYIAGDLFVIFPESDDLLAYEAGHLRGAVIVSSALLLTGQDMDLFGRLFGKILSEDFAPSEAFKRMNHGMKALRPSRGETPAAAAAIDILRETVINAAALPILLPPAAYSSDILTAGDRIQAAALQLVADVTNEFAPEPDAPGKKNGFAFIELAAAMAGVLGLGAWAGTAFPAGLTSGWDTVGLPMPGMMMVLKGAFWIGVLGAGALMFPGLIGMVISNDDDSSKEPAYQASRITGPEEAHLVEIACDIALLAGDSLGFGAEQVYEVIRQTPIQFYRWEADSRVHEGALEVFLSKGMEDSRDAYELMLTLTRLWAYRLLDDFVKSENGGKEISPAVYEAYGWILRERLTNRIAPVYADGENTVFRQHAESGHRLRAALKALSINPDVFQGGDSADSRKVLTWMIHDLVDRLDPHDRRAAVEAPLHPFARHFFRISPDALEPQPLSAADFLGAALAETILKRAGKASRAGHLLGRAAFEDPSRFQTADDFSAAVSYLNEEHDSSYPFLSGPAGEIDQAERDLQRTLVEVEMTPLPSAVDLVSLQGENSRQASAARLIKRVIDAYLEGVLGHAAVPAPEAVEMDEAAAFREIPKDIFRGRQPELSSAVRAVVAGALKTHFGDPSKPGPVRMRRRFLLQGLKHTGFSLEKKRMSGREFFAFLDVWIQTNGIGPGTLEKSGTEYRWVPPDTIEGLPAPLEEIMKALEETLRAVQEEVNSIPFSQQDAASRQPGKDKEGRASPGEFAYASGVSALRIIIARIIIDHLRHNPDREEVWIPAQRMVRDLEEGAFQWTFSATFPGPIEWIHKRILEMGPIGGSVLERSIDSDDYRWSRPSVDLHDILVSLDEEFSPSQRTQGPPQVVPETVILVPPAEAFPVDPQRVLRERALIALREGNWRRVHKLTQLESHQVLWRDIFHASERVTKNHLQPDDVIIIRYPQFSNYPRIGTVYRRLPNGNWQITLDTHVLDLYPTSLEEGWVRRLAAADTLKPLPLSGHDWLDEAESIVQSLSGVQPPNEMRKALLNGIAMLLSLFMSEVVFQKQKSPVLVRTAVNKSNALGVSRVAVSTEWRDQPAAVMERLLGELANLEPIRAYPGVLPMSELLRAVRYIVDRLASMQAPSSHKGFLPVEVMLVLGAVSGAPLLLGSAWSVLLAASAGVGGSLYLLRPYLKAAYRLTLQPAARTLMTAA